MRFKTRTYRPRHKPGRMNKTELEYARHLEHKKQSGEILDYSFECTRLKIGDDCWYTPDFRIIRKTPCENGKELGCSSEYIEFHEVKGTIRKNRTVGNKINTTKPFIEDDALVKIKAASFSHPYKFIIVWKNGIFWENREIN